MERIYCIPGIGADETVFKKLQVPGKELVHIHWPEFDKHDELGCYAQKIIPQIKEENPVILGLSFGGMLAIEIAKIHPVRKIILVSSAKTKYELPQYGKFFRTLILSQVIPSFLYTIPNTVTYKLFGAHKEEEIDMLKGVFENTDGKLMKWAMKAITLWRNETYPEPLVHIHGTADKILPIENIHANYIIEGGSHIMIYNRAQEISNIIAKELTS